MFSKDFSQSSPSFAEDYGAFLDSGLLTTNPVPLYSGEIPWSGARWKAYLVERHTYFQNARQWHRTDHLLIDPDTGLWLPTSDDAKQRPAPKPESTEEMSVAAW